MSKINVAIIDTGCANITSVRCAFERICDDVTVTRDQDFIRAASHVVLPGVGTAGAAMEKLVQFDLITFIQSFNATGTGDLLRDAIANQVFAGTRRQLPWSNRYQGIGDEKQ